MTGAPPTSPDILVVVLAGGRGTRMAQAPGGSVQKGLVPLADRPLVAHVLDRLRPQARRLALNVNGDLTPWLGFGLPLIPDADTSFSGPLAGFAAGLAYAATLNPAPEMVVFVPTDTPFLPHDLIARLIADDADRVAVAAGPGGLEPAIAAVPLRLTADLAAHRAAERASGGKGSLRDWLQRHDPRVVSFAAAHPGAPDPFTNVNTPAELGAAEHRLAGG